MPETSAFKHSKAAASTVFHNPSIAPPGSNTWHPAGTQSWFKSDGAESRNGQVRYVCAKQPPKKSKNKEDQESILPHYFLWMTLVTKTRHSLRKTYSEVLQLAGGINHVVNPHWKLGNCLIEKRSCLHVRANITYSRPVSPSLIHCVFLVSCGFCILWDPLGLKSKPYLAAFTVNGCNMLQNRGHHCKRLAYMSFWPSTASLLPHLSSSQGKDQVREQIACLGH